MYFLHIYTHSRNQYNQYIFFQLERYLSSISKPKGPFHPNYHIAISEFWTKTETPSIGWSFLEKPPVYSNPSLLDRINAPVQRGCRVWGTILEAWYPGTIGFLVSPVHLRLAQYATFVSHNVAFIVADSCAWHGITWRGANIHILVRQPRSITILLTIEAYARACIHRSRIEKERRKGNDDAAEDSFSLIRIWAFLEFAIFTRGCKIDSSLLRVFFVILFKILYYRCRSFEKAIIRMEEKRCSRG